MSTATIEAVLTKACTKCGETKVLGSFTKDKRKRDGRRPACKACEAEQKRAYRAANREKVLEQERAYREASREALAERDRAYYEANREAVAERRRAHRAANRETIAERDRAYYAANREAVAEYRRAYYAANPHVHWASKYRTRARAYGFPIVVEEFTKADVVTMYGDYCTYCETGAFEHLDHFVPVAKGGPHTLENARPSCGACNRAKGEMSGDEWEQRQVELDEMSHADLEDAIDAEIAKWSA